MPWHIWLAFAAASAAMGLIPGPGVTSIVGYAISSGRRTALASVAGMAMGNGIAMSLSLAGVGALLATSALAFTALKWAGAVYLMGLGMITILKNRDPARSAARAAVKPWAAFAGNVAVGTFHPKTIVFYVAFVPQFISARGDYVSQAAILIATFCLVVAVTDACYALAAARAQHLLRKPKAIAWARRAGGGILIAAGVAAARSRS